MFSNMTYWRYFRNLLVLAVATSQIAAPANMVPQTPPSLSPFGDGEWWVLTKTLQYKIGKAAGTIIIPAGFTTDLASTPSLVWTFFPRSGNYMSAAILHDYLYYDQRCTREQADNIFKLEMREFGVSKATLFLIYTAVDLVGWLFWDDKSPRGDTRAYRIIPPKPLESFLGAQLTAKQSWALVRGKVNVEDYQTVKDYMDQSFKVNDGIREICGKAVQEL